MNAPIDTTDDASTEEPAREATGPAKRRTWGKVLAGLFSIAMISATAAPVAENWKAAPKDSFPLSYYPMFSQKRADLYQVHYIVGLDAQGNRRLLSHKLAGSGGFNQTRRQINRFVREKKAGELCTNIAAKVARDKEYSEIVTVRIVTGSYRFDDYFHGNKAPVSERVRATAKVKRGAS